ncbi:penicillin acylase family protein [Maricaulis sp.]|uniref:penicillin acylase family protein n=1 Tax=Maricaulis sp. TaxID=1486257 RepID=UPI002601B02A|nr:penicillin acylase family protein [Maricaulis sp.]
MSARLLRYAGWTLGSVAAIAILAVLVVANRLYASLPQTSGTLEVDGLDAEAQIVRDRHAIPHVFAGSDRDAFFALGVAHAQDRLWQMEITRRALRGRVAELLGRDALDTDIFFRTMGLGEAADDAAVNLPADVQAALDAYSAGVNTVIEAPGFVPPPEFQILMTAPEPWTPADTVVVYKAIALDLFGNAFQEPRRAALDAHLGAGRAAEFVGRYPADAPRSLSMADMGLPGNAAPADTPVPVLGPEDNGRDGSNNWVLAGSRTASGLPILANDPHLGLSAPGIWYLARLTTPDGSVVGATLPGTPFVTLGRNDRIAWGFTNTGPDVGDLHAVTEEAVVDSREETIRVRFGADVTITRRATATGPVLDPEHFDYPLPDGADFFSLQWMLDEPDDATAGVGLHIIDSDDWPGFVDAIRGFTAPQQNMVFASRSGDIGFYAPARIPVRDRAGNWVSTIPFDELPHALNPERGFVATANNKIVPDGYPHFITGEWYGVSRIRRIYEGIEGSQQHDLDTMAALQTDTVSDMARRILPVLLTARASSEAGRTALTLLEDWDADMAADRPEPLVYAAWMRELNRAVYADELGDLFSAWYADRRVFMMDVLTGDLAHWCDDITTDAAETCADLLGPALDRAMAGATAEYGRNIASWRWGEAHYARHDHTPFSGIPLLSDWFTIETPVPGDGSTVNVAHYAFRTPGYAAFHGASYRALYDMADPEASRFMITTGQSGNVMSRHYDDLAPLWGRGEYLEIRTDWDLSSAPEGTQTLRLQPGSQ